MTEEQLLSKEDATLALSEHLNNNDWRRLLLVHGHSSYSLCGARETFFDVLSDFQTDYLPVTAQYVDAQAIEDALSKIRSPYDAVIAVGGGSVIDTAKLIALSSSESNLEITSCIHSQEPLASCLPILAIPTTAGSGSEATQFAAVYERGVKYSVDTPVLLPDHFMLVPDFLQSLPPYQMACSAADAVCQSIESIWAVRGNAKSQQYAEDALRHMLSALPHLANPTSEDYRNLMLGAHLAGKAINISRTTGPHAVSYALTSLFNIPHGHAVALMMPAFIILNADIGDENCHHQLGPRYVKEQLGVIFKALGSDSADLAAKEFVRLMAESGLEMSCDEMEIRAVDFRSRLPELVSAERLGNNPREISPADLSDLVRTN